MKKIIILLLVLALLCACGEKYTYEPARSTAIEYTAGDITLEVTGRGLTGETEIVIAKLSNNSDKILYHDSPGGPGGLEFFVDGQWCYRTTGERASTSALLYFIHPGESVEKRIDVGKLEPGLYRIRASFWLEPMETIRDQVYCLDFEFEIE